MNINLSVQSDRPFDGRWMRVLWALAGKGAVLLYLTTVLLAMLAYFSISGTPSAAAYVGTSALALVALLVGVHIHHPSNAWPWRWLALGQAAFLLGDVIWFAGDLSGTGSFPSLADASYLSGYPIFAVGLALFIISRRPKYSIARLVDAGAIGLSFLVLLMLAYVPKIAGDPGLDDLGKLTLLAYPAGDAVLLGAAAYLLFGGNGWRGRAQMSLLAGLVLLMVADVLYGLYLSDTEYARSVLDATWMLSYGAIGLTALLPSMRDMTHPRAGAAEAGATRAMMALLVAVAVLTVATVAGDTAGHGPDQAVIEVVQIALIGLLFLRAHESTSREARHERRVAALLANASDAMAVVGADGVIRLSNPAAERLVGIPASASGGKSVFDFLTLLHPDDQSSSLGQMRVVLSTPGAQATSDLRVRQADGSYRWLTVSAVNRVADPNVGAVVMNFRDVTELRRSTANLLRLRTAIDQASDAVIVTDAQARIEYVNPAFEQITGYTRDEVIGRNPRILRSGEQSPGFYESMWKMLTDGKQWRADFVNRRKDGTLYRMVGVITPLRNDAGQLTGYVGVQRDVTRQRELESSAHRLARERTLVAEMIRGLDPRESPEKIAQSVCNQLTTMSELALAGIFIFEADGRATPYGLSVREDGNPPRRRLARARTRYLRERSAAGPWIETWIDHPGHPYTEMTSRLGIRAHAYAPVRDGNHVIGFIVVGIAAANAEERLASMLPAIVEVADIGGAQMGVKVTEQTELTAERARIAKIIDSRAFFPVYQALCDAQTGRVVGYEALTRFDDGTAPQIRFAEAHEVGLGEKLELAAVAAAIEGAAGLPGEMWLNVNASPSVVMDGGELNRLVGEGNRDFVLEVTEHAEITDYQTFRQAVQELGPKVRLAVDDAGAGFASLRHIIELRPAFVKLDRQVIAGIDADKARQAMVAGLHHFARTTGCWLIAEGVETDAELRTLRELEVSYVQGYLLGRPVPANGLAHESPHKVGKRPSLSAVSSGRPSNPAPSA